MFVQSRHIALTSASECCYLRRCNRDRDQCLFLWLLLCARSRRSRRNTRNTREKVTWFSSVKRYFVSSGEAHVTAKKKTKKTISAKFNKIKKQTQKVKQNAYQPDKTRQKAKFRGNALLQSHEQYKTNSCCQLGCSRRKLNKQWGLTALDRGWTFD